jgi:hypothetical protein
MSGARYVPTGEAQKAVARHETEILDALGIPWRSGRPHIDCPYPSHGGKGIGDGTRKAPKRIALVVRRTRSLMFL